MASSTTWRCGLLAPALALALVLPARAAPGQFDTGFASGGIYSFPDTNVSNHFYGNWLALQPDGRIVAANEFLHAYGSGGLANAVRKSVPYRLHPNGTLDTGFGNGGVATGFADVREQAVLVQPDGRIVLAGISSHNYWPDRGFFVSRYNANGSLDSSFGNSGVVQTPVRADPVNFPGGSTVKVMQAILQQDGRIVLLASMRLQTETYPREHMVLLRYLPDGRLDSSLSGTGIAKLRLNMNLYAYGLAEQADGKLLVSGYTVMEGLGNTNYGIVLRLNADGSLDTSFGTDGSFLLPQETSEDFNLDQVAVQPDGKIVFTGNDQYAESFTSVHLDTLVGRLHPDGSLDTSFGDDGLARQLFFTASGIFKPYENLRLLLQPDGRIVISTSDRRIGESLGNYVLRLLPDGTVDRSFGADGLLALLPGGLEGTDSIIATPDGRLLLGGYSDFGNFVEVPRIYSLLANDANNDGNAEAWDLQPGPINLVPSRTEGSTVLTSAAVITGLGSGVSVPVTVSGTDVSVNEGDFTRHMSYVGNGDTVSLRFTSGEQPRVLVGGMHAGNNRALILGPRVTATIGQPSALSPLQVRNVAPQPDSVQASLRPRLTVVFATRLAPETLNGSSFRLSCNGVPVVAQTRLERSGTVAHLRPLWSLPRGAVCSATLTTAVADTEGRHLPGNFSWQFTLR